tara:strand:+ start:865 stop:1467 length:603 start_codon:yes stop_codon:yes gene_type:complete
MEKLIVTSKILYDNDISNKMKEITELKEEYKPEIIFSSQEEWEENKEKAFAIIKDYIKIWHMIVSPMATSLSLVADRWVPIKYPTDVIRIFDGIYEALNLITKNKYETWCSNQSWIIVNSILGFIVGLQKTGNLISVWENIQEIIYNSIIEQLELSGQGHGNDVVGILQDTCFIYCEKCDKKYPVIFQDGCIECNPNGVY